MTPRISFLIGGAQKGGTTALAQYLGAHPEVLLPTGKEAHVFDSPGFDDRWEPARIDAEYERFFPTPLPAGKLVGDATPIYMFHPVFIDRIARYSPGMRWIVLLRDPVERAISHFHMERRRGQEILPLWLALLAEAWRLMGHQDDFSFESPLRKHSYVARGRYSRQLDALHARFPAEQILLVRSRDLIATPGSCMERILDFLGLSPFGDKRNFERVFEGRYASNRFEQLTGRLLRLYYRGELKRLAGRYDIRFDPEPALA